MRGAVATQRAGIASLLSAGEIEEAGVLCLPSRVDPAVEARAGQDEGVVGGPALRAGVVKMNALPIASSSQPTFNTKPILDSDW